MGGRAGGRDLEAQGAVLDGVGDEEPHDLDGPELPEIGRGVPGVSS